MTKMADQEKNNRRRYSKNLLTDHIYQTQAGVINRGDKQWIKETPQVSQPLQLNDV